MEFDTKVLVVYANDMKTVLYTTSFETNQYNRMGLATFIRNRIDDKKLPYVTEVRVELQYLRGESKYDRRPFDKAYIVLDKDDFFPDFR